MDPIRICICSMKDPDPDPGGRPWYGLTGMRSGILFLSPCVLCSILCLGKMKCSVFSFVPCLPGEIYCCIWGLCGQSPSPPPPPEKKNNTKSTTNIYITVYTVQYRGEPVWAILHFECIKCPSCTVLYKQYVNRKARRFPLHPFQSWRTRFLCRCFQYFW